MKRYYLNQYGEMVEDKTGEFNNNKHVKQWVKADIAEELYEVVSELSVYKDSPVPNILIHMADKVLKKARSERE